MPAGNCCCGKINLRKYDPSDGSIIWSAAIYGAASHVSVPSILRIEALHGTDDVMVLVGGGGGFVRVDTTGAEVWSYYSSAINTQDSSLLQPRDRNRPFDVDAYGTTVFSIQSSNHSLLRLLDPNGNLSASGYDYGLPTQASNIRIFPNKREAIVIVRDLSSGHRTLYSNSTVDGSLNWLVAGSGLVQAADYQYKFLDDQLATSPTLQRDGASGATLLTFPSGSANHNVRATPNAYVCTDGHFEVSATDLSGNVNWSATTLGGWILGNGMFDAAADDSGGYYYCGQPANGDVSPSVFKTDTSGNYLWGNKYSLHSRDGTVNYARGVCVADDGYVYVCGDAVFI